MSFIASPSEMSPTSLNDVDKAIASLHEKRNAWREVRIEERVKLLDACVRSIHGVAEKWARIGAAIKGVDPNDNLAGEEWLAGVMPAIRNARLLANALRAKGKPRAALRKRPDGRTVARVFPSNLMERLMFFNFYADVWIEQGKPPSQGAIYNGDSKSKEKDGRVCLVLGGGNVSSIPAMDALHKLFAEDEVVLLKMNPVNEALGPVLEEAFKPLVDGGWLAVIYGGAEVGKHAAEHPKVGSLHVTGSDRTYDAIVWGPEEGRAERKAKGERVNEKPFSAELGCVTPVIIVPGPWSDSDIIFQARHVASMITQNASFNCNAAKVIIMARQWLQRDAFRAALHAALKNTPPRKAYYPGAKERYGKFIEHYPSANVLGAEKDGAIPWTLIPDISESSNNYALTNEAFCGVAAEYFIDAPDFHGAHVPRFLEEAVKLANEKCWGTLSCCLLAHPATQDKYEDLLRKAIEDLRYGAVGLNVWPGAIYALCSPTWGAYPGHKPEDIQSGVGVVHNAFLYDHPEKTLVTAPFRIRPIPAWFSEHKNLLELGRALVDFEANPTWGGMTKVAIAALKG